MNDWPFNPVLFRIGPFEAHWYGLMYALAFLAGYLFLHYSKPGKKLTISDETKDAVVIVTILGIVLGARLGYALLYNFEYYGQNPLKFLAVWEGGMASHGALTGSVIAVIIYTKIKKIKLLPITDTILSIAPVGIILVRLGNFINAELYGRIADQFCIHFPTDPTNCRYPSQLFQAALEGAVLLIILQIVIHKKPSPKTGTVTSLFLMLYGIFRIIGELFRQPDPQIGFLFAEVTQGQLLSGIMVLAGIILYLHVNSPRKPKKT